MTTDPDTILLETEETMQKAADYLKHELRGLRTGRASTALVEFIKVEAYGTSSDLKSLAIITLPEPTQILIKPFDPGTVGDIRKAIEASGLGLNPMVEAKQIRLNLPALSGDRRQQLVTKCRKMGEEAKVALRNVRRDANRHADGLSKAAHPLPEDEIKILKDEIQELLKKFETDVDARVEEKCKEIQEV